MLLRHSQSTSGVVDYSMGENICMSSGDMNLSIKTGTVGYNNKIPISDGKFSLGKNDNVNAKSTSSAKTTKIESHKCWSHAAIFLLHKLSKTSK